ATHLLYIEDGIAHVFDRLSAFEDWLNSPPQLRRGEPRPQSGRGWGGVGQEIESFDQHHPGAPRPPSSAEEGSSHKPPLSKNKREQLEKEVASVEKKIAAVESEIAELELSFQNPATGTDWESTHRRYADLKVSLESLYGELARHWELMGQ